MDHKKVNYLNFDTSPPLKILFSRYALCPMPFALCSMRHALCPMLHALCVCLPNAVQIHLKFLLFFQQITLLLSHFFNYFCRSLV